MAGLGFNPVMVGFALASLGYVIGLALQHAPLSAEGKSWGGSLISYSLMTAMFLAVVGSGEALHSLAESVSKTVAGAGGIEHVSVEEIPQAYFNVATRAMGILAAIAGTNTVIALIPIVGPPISNVLSVFSTLPSMALTGTMILSLVIAVTTMIFITFAPVMIPLGVVLIAVPRGKLKGVGGWLIAMSLALAAVGPLIPGVGVMACGGNEGKCTLQEMTKPFDLKDLPGQTAEGLIFWMFNVQDNTIMKMWSFTLGSMIAFSIMSVAAAALSRAIGGVAASLGIG
jgi:hypothetical protein